MEKWKEATGLTASTMQTRNLKARKYNTRYNNISRKVLGFKSPNEVLKEYKENQQVKDTLGKKYFF